MAIVVAGIVAGCSPTTQPSATPTASAVASSSSSTALPSGSPPTPSPSAAASCADRTFAALTETQRIGQLFMVGLKKDQLDSTLEAAIAGSHFGSVAFTKQTAVGVAAVRALTDAVQALATRAATGRIGFFVSNQVPPAIEMAQALADRAARNDAFRARIDDAARRVLEAKAAAGLLPCGG